MAKYSIPEIRERLAKFPRVELIHRPTPFRRLERLSRVLGGPEIWIKRDDLTGLAFGGNKSRKLEYILKDALDKGADTIVTWGGVQSNWCLQTAAAARAFGLRPVLVLFKSQGAEPACDGNLLLDALLDAEIRFHDARPGKVVQPEQAMDVVAGVAEEKRRAGGRPYLVPVGGSRVLGDMDRPLGAVGYVDSCLEMFEQARAAGFEPDAVVHATGSGGTQAGFVVGAKAVSERCRVVGISVSDPKGPFGRDVLVIAQAADGALGLGLGVEDGDVLVQDDYIGGGYGAVTTDIVEAIRLVFRTEGIILDPVYTAKAMAGLIDLVRRGFFRPGERLVFFHTGGTPALFPNRESIARELPSKPRD